MLKEIFHDSFEDFEVTRICMENHARVTGWQKLFFSYKYLRLSACANKICQKWTVFVFTESLSRDQVMQRAYCIYRHIRYTCQKMMKVENLLCPLKPTPQKRSWYIYMLESLPLSTTIQQLISAPLYKTVSLYLRTILLRFHVLLLEFCSKFECLTVLWYLSLCNYCFCGGQVLTF